ncbi:MAG: hypothetical protein LBR10_01650 [Prevotellaceae bacterium]|jgi:hypothetical protein|nr:hypothetical protein [Prevotellaceae bacterium]
MVAVNFSIMQLIEESTSSGDRFVFPTSDTFATLNESIQFNDEQTYFEISVEKTTDDIFFVFNFGNPTPRDNKLTDVITGEKRENSRTNTEAELNNQAFFLYHFQKNLLYLSKSQKKTAFERMLKEKLDTDFKLKTIFKDIDAFLNTLRECNQISFSHINDLFSSDSTKKQALVDLTGTDAPNEFTITAKYSKPRIENFIRSIVHEKSDNKISSLVINGFDEKGFGIVYNTENFQQKITINATKDENGKFNSAEIRNNLLNEINR